MPSNCSTQASLGGPRAMLLSLQAFDSKDIIPPPPGIQKFQFQNWRLSLNSTSDTEVSVSGFPTVALNVFPQLEVRYSDGYKAAKAIVGFGNLVKILGAVAGVIIALVALSVPGALFVGGAVLGGLVWLGLFVGGIVICAQGQLLLATLDSAVNTSPFLDNLQRSSIMSISATPAVPEGLNEGLNEEGASSMAGQL